MCGSFRKDKIIQTLLKICTNYVKHNIYNYTNTMLPTQWILVEYNGFLKDHRFVVDKKIQLDVTFCILYFSSNSYSTCFGQPCAHQQELTTA